MVVRGYRELFNRARCRTRRRFVSVVELLVGTLLEIDSHLAKQALLEALQAFPQFGTHGPALEWRPLLKGGAFVVNFENAPPRETPLVWDFQNAVVKRYKQLTQVDERSAQG